MNYDKDLQVMFLHILVNQKDLFARCQSIIKPQYFDKELRKAVTFITEYSDKYKAVPTPELIHANTGLKLEPLVVTQDIEDWFLDEIEKFCRHKEMESIIYSGPDIIEAGDYAIMEERIKEAMAISLQKDLGTDYFYKPDERLERIRVSQQAISTGWKSLDYRLYGGWAKKTLNIFAGQPGAGKSLFLQNISINYMEMGMNVLYISLELSEELVASRFDSMICGIPTKDIRKDSAMAAVALKLGAISKGKRMGSLRIKKMPEGTTTTRDIRAYIKEYEIQTGIRPDVVAVDYLDLLAPNNPKINPTDTFTKDKFVAEELRALSFEIDCILMTASQLNRTSNDAAFFDMSHIAGGISKLNTADNMMAIYRTVAMKEAGKYELQLMKTRTSNGVGSKVTLTVDKESMRITDEEEPEVENISSISTSSGIAGLSRMSSRT